MKLKNKIKEFIIDKFWLTTSLFLAFAVFFMLFVYFFLFDFDFQKRMLSQFYEIIFGFSIFFICLIAAFIFVISPDDIDDKENF